MIPMEGGGDGQGKSLQEMAEGVPLPQLRGDSHFPFRLWTMLKGFSAAPGFPGSNNSPECLFYPFLARSLPPYCAGPLAQSISHLSSRDYTDFPGAIQAVCVSEALESWILPG
ncbi:protein reprimo [Platysternon megacephalum]|uniref:Protein reprimo n=1 Tax=Platysternon megacephalum TaxID=55544 RepID=A0A4D9F5J0_9SAUR|nr:protein reprimo [Platysternon megacephalum]